jgi:hypothetical protein
VQGKVVYVAPLPALCEERAADWRAKLGPLGIDVQLLSGEPAADVKLLCACLSGSLVLYLLSLSLSLSVSRL